MDIIKSELELLKNKMIYGDDKKYNEAFKYIFYCKAYEILNKNKDLKVNYISLESLYNEFSTNHNMEFIFDDKKSIEIIKKLIKNIKFKNLRKLQEQLTLEEKMIVNNEMCIYLFSKKIYVLSCIVSYLENSILNELEEEKTITDEELNFSLNEIYNYYEYLDKKNEINLEDDESLEDFILNFIKINKR